MVVALVNNNLPIECAQKDILGLVNGNLEATVGLKTRAVLGPDEINIWKFQSTDSSTDQLDSAANPMRPTR